MREDKQQKNSAEGTRPEFAEGFQAYIDPLLTAWRELDEIEAKEKEFAIRKSRLKATVEALKPLVFKEAWDINSLGLSDAIRFVIQNAGRALSARDIRTKFEDFDYDLSGFDNPLASIHTALKRMAETDELVELGEDGKKKTFTPGPDLKPVLPGSNASDEAMRTALAKK
jgi:hypothetical protein